MFVSWIVFVFLSGVVFVFVCFFICGDEGEGLIKCWLFRDPAGTFGVAFVFVSWLVYVFVSGVVFVFVCLFLFLFYFYLWGWRRGTNQVQGIQGSSQHIWSCTCVCIMNCICACIMTCICVCIRSCICFCMFFLFVGMKERD